jgi:hypothetical protein
MNRPPHSDLRPYLDRVGQLPFVSGIEVRTAEPDGREGWDALLSVRTPKGRHELAVEFKSAPLTPSGAQHLLSQVSNDHRHKWLVFSPYVPAPVGELLATQGVGYLDQAGNYHVALGKDFLAHVEGRRPAPKPREGRGLGATAYQVLFALLAQPDLAGAPVRHLAEAAGVRKSTAADMRRRLEEEGLIVRDRGGRRLPQPGALLDRWVVGYADKLRRRLIVGRYRAPEQPAESLESRIEEALRERTDWAWGGATAALRLTHHYRSDTTTLHVEEPLGDLPRRVSLLASVDGRVVILRAPGPLGLKGPIPHVAHPLLVYSELLVEGGERAREAASDVRDRYLKWAD